MVGIYSLISRLARSQLEGDSTYALEPGLFDTTRANPNNPIASSNALKMPKPPTGRESVALRAERVP
jgi:hypothetical protein